MKITKVLYFTILISFLSTSCSKVDPRKITLPADLSESNSAPIISKIMDYGSYTLPSEGKIKKFKKNSSFVIGDLLLIRGKNFGRLPTVTISKKAAPILLRLADGGIFVRIPSKIKAGKQMVIVSNEKGLSEKEINIKRYAFAHAPSAKETFLFDAYRWKKIKSYKMGDVREIFMAKNSPFAYIITKLSSGYNLLTLDLSVSPLPKIVDKKLIFKDPMIGAGYSPVNKVIAVMSSKGVRVFTLGTPRYPIAHSLQNWPDKTGSKMMESVLSPDGKTIVSSIKVDNSINLYDIQVPDNIKKGPSLKLITEDKVPLLRKISFNNDPQDQVLYALTGDTPQSLKVGYHAMSMILVDIKSAKDRTGNPVVKISEKQPLMVEKGAPTRMFISKRGASKVEDTSLSKWTKYIYFTILHAELLTLKSQPLSTPSGLQQGIEMIKGLKYLTILHRLDNKNNPKQFRKTKSVTGNFAISYDGKYMLGVNCTPVPAKEGLKISIGCEIETVQLSTMKSQKIPSGKLKKSQFVPFFRFGAVGCQD